eukprot:m51a1_g8238 hypothetical protein (688) ;mRNA; r:86479-95403
MSGAFKEDDLKGLARDVKRKSMEPTLAAAATATAGAPEPDPKRQRSGPSSPAAATSAAPDTSLHASSRLPQSPAAAAPHTPATASQQSPMLLKRSGTPLGAAPTMEMRNSLKHILERLEAMDRKMDDRWVQEDRDRRADTQRICGEVAAGRSAALGAAGAGAEGCIPAARRGLEQLSAAWGRGSAQSAENEQLKKQIEALGAAVKEKECSLKAKEEHVRALQLETEKQKRTLDELTKSESQRKLDDVANASKISLLEKDKVSLLKPIYAWTRQRDVWYVSLIEKASSRAGVVVLALLYRPAGEGSATCKGLTPTVTLPPEPGAKTTREASEVVVATLGQRTEGDEQCDTANATTQGHVPAIRRGKKCPEVHEDLKSTAPQCERQFECYYCILFKVEHFSMPDAGALGIHALRLQNDRGRAVFVMLDYCVPCGSTKRKGDTEPHVQPIYAWTRQRDVWYVSLIEKAFAVDSARQPCPAWGVVVLELLYRPAGEGSATCKGLTLTVTLSPEPGAEKTREASEVVVATLGQRTEVNGEQCDTANATTQGHVPAIRRGRKWYADDDEDSIVDNTRAKGSQVQQQQQQAALEQRLRVLEQKAAALEHTGGSHTATKQQQKGNSGSNNIKLPMLSGSSSDHAARTPEEYLKRTAPQCERQFKCYYCILFKVEHFSVVKGIPRKDTMTTVTPSP